MMMGLYEGSSVMMRALACLALAAALAATPLALTTTEAMAGAKAALYLWLKGVRLPVIDGL